MLKVVPVCVFLVCMAYLSVKRVIRRLCSEHYGPIVSLVNCVGRSRPFITTSHAGQIRSGDGKRANDSELRH